MKKLYFAAAYTWNERPLFIKKIGIASTFTVSCETVAAGLSRLQTRNFNADTAETVTNICGPSIVLMATKADPVADP